MGTAALLLHEGVRALGITNPVAYLIDNVAVVPSGESLRDDHVYPMRINVVPAIRGGVGRNFSM